jgi:hypothetical protein
VVRGQGEQPPGEVLAGRRVAYAERLLGEVAGDPGALVRGRRKAGHPLEQWQPRLAVPECEVPEKCSLQVGEVVRIAYEQGVDLARHPLGGGAAIVRSLELDLPASGTPARGVGRDLGQALARGTRPRVCLGRKRGTYAPAEQRGQPGRVGRFRNGVEARQR